MTFDTLVNPSQIVSTLHVPSEFGAEALIIRLQDPDLANRQALMIRYCEYLQTLSTISNKYYLIMYRRPVIVNRGQVLIVETVYSGKRDLNGEMVYEDGNTFLPFNLSNIDSAKVRPEGMVVDGINGMSTYGQVYRYIDEILREFDNFEG